MYVMYILIDPCTLSQLFTTFITFWWELRLLVNIRLLYLQKQGKYQCRQKGFSLVRKKKLLKPFLYFFVFGHPIWYFITHLIPGQLSNWSTPNEVGDVRMEQLCLLWHSSSTVLNASLMVHDNPLDGTMSDDFYGMWLTSSEEYLRNLLPNMNNFDRFS